MKIKRRLYKTIMAYPPCDVCKIHFTSELHAKQHYSGKNHKKKVKVAGNFQMPTCEQTANPAVPSFDLSYCQVCNVAYSSDVQRNEHIQGKQHQNASTVKRELDEGLQLYCKYCNVHFTKNEQKLEHEASESHKKKQASSLQNNAAVVPSDAGLQLPNRPNSGPIEGQVGAEAQGNIRPIVPSASQSTEEALRVIPIGSKFTKDGK